MLTYGNGCACSCTWEHTPAAAALPPLQGPPQPAGSTCSAARLSLTLLTTSVPEIITAPSPHHHHSLTTASPQPQYIIRQHCCSPCHDPPWVHHQAALLPQYIMSVHHEIAAVLAAEVVVREHGGAQHHRCSQLHDQRARGDHLRGGSSTRVSSALACAAALALVLAACAAGLCVCSSACYSLLQPEGHGLGAGGTPLPCQLAPLYASLACCCLDIPRRTAALPVRHIQAPCCTHAPAHAPVWLVWPQSRWPRTL